MIRAEDRRTGEQSTKEEHNESTKEEHDESIWPIIPALICVPFILALTSYQVYLWDQYVCTATGFVCIRDFLWSLGWPGQWVAVCLTLTVSIAVWIIVFTVLIWGLSLICSGTYVSIAYGWLWCRHGTCPTGHIV